MAFFHALLAPSQPSPAAIDGMLERSLALIDEVQGVPLMLSLLTAFFKRRAPNDSSPLPTDVLSLCRAALAGAASDIDDPNAAATLPMLQTLALAAQAARRSDFSGSEADERLVEMDQQLLWNQLSARHEVPLVKTVASDGKGHDVFQFRHASLQEALAAADTVAHPSRRAAAPADAAEDIAELLREPMNQGMLRVGGPALGTRLAARQLHLEREAEVRSAVPIEAVARAAVVR